MDFFVSRGTINPVYDPLVEKYLFLLTGLKGIWYFRKVAISCEQFDPLSISLCQKYKNFCFKNLENGREDKNVHKLLLV